MLTAEDDIEKLKGENSSLNKIGMKTTDDCSSLQEQVHQLELDLTISQEKHRTCQKEVAVSCFHKCSCTRAQFHNQGFTLSVNLNNC